MLQTEASKLLHLEKELEKRVVVESVCEAIRRSRSGLQEPKRPLGVFLFVGPTGVGKTELAKSLAEQLFDNEDAIIRFDMSEYIEKHSVSRLIGAPPGYVGYDEIEKAHPDVFNIFLQIFDDGRITDSKGRVANCKNALFIKTSNLGAEQLLESINSSSSELKKEEVLSIVEPVLKSHFRPEFLNRLDEVLPFLPLQRKEMDHIITIQLKSVANRLSSRNITLSWDEAIVKYLGDTGYDPAFGARPLKRLIQKEVVNTLSTKILDGSASEHSHIHLELKNKQVCASIKQTVS